MFEVQRVVKRRIEIVGLCLNVGEAQKISLADLAEEFHVDELTIKRDLKELRFVGIDIHSTKNFGVIVSTHVSHDKIKEILLHYAGIINYNNVYDKSTALLVEKKSASALNHFIRLQLCIENCCKAKIVYHHHNFETQERIVNPLLIFHSEGSWRLLTQEDGIVKQFHLDKISSVESTDQSFQRMSKEKFENLFKHSWGSWIGKDKFHVRLLFDKVWAERINQRMLVSDQKIINQPGGSILFEAEVNSLAEIASWIVSRGKGCTVLAPEELKEQVVKIAKDTLSNYKK
ncbi:MAG: transcriptional regulator [Ignavibacteria bacterium]|nr:transcriptional regulator [Ignavibacteria bacterium]